GITYCVLPARGNIFSRGFSQGEPYEVLMEQPSVVMQTTGPREENHTPGGYPWKWMRHFFSEDVSPDNSPVVELQRRAVWIGLALILQAPNEIDHNSYMPYLKSFGSLVPFALILGSFIAMVMAIRPTSL